MNQSNVPQPVVVADDFSSIPKVISYVLISTNVLAVAAKFLSRGAVQKLNILNMDNSAISAGLVFAIGHLVTVSVAAHHGMGKYQSSLDLETISAYEKSVYAGQIFYILSLTFSKGSVLVLLRKITPNSAHRLLISISACFLVAWGAIGLLVASFQCAMPTPWNTFQVVCINKVEFWLCFAVINILLEISFIAIAGVIIYGIFIPPKKRISIFSAFGVRILVVGAVIAEMCCRVMVVNESDRIFNDWKIAVGTMFVESFSIVFHCVAYVKPLIGLLESGLVKTIEKHRIPAIIPRLHRRKRSISYELSKIRRSFRLNKSAGL